MAANRSGPEGPPRWPYYGAALAVAIVLALLSAYVVWQERAAAYASERRAALNTARLVADNLGESSTASTRS